jgi:DNA-binding transcriptional MerR regulator
MLSIGDFSRMTQLSVKTLRHYHDVGLILPHHVDGVTGYRYYSHDQVPTAQVVSRLRALDMPVPEVKAMLAADPAQRNSLIAAHLDRLEARLASTQNAVRALRDILAPVPGPRLEHRSVPSVQAIAVHAEVDREELPTWFFRAVTEVLDDLRARGHEPLGPPAGLYGYELFASDRGPVTVFVPVAGGEFTVPAAELVVIRHRGAHDDVDLAYSELGEYATRHELSVEAPLREYYETFAWDTDDSTQWVTELCWPILRSDREGDA